MLNLALGNSLSVGLEKCGNPCISVDFSNWGCGFALTGREGMHQNGERHEQPGSVVVKVPQVTLSLKEMVG